MELKPEDGMVIASKLKLLTDIVEDMQNPSYFDQKLFQEEWTILKNKVIEAGIVSESEPDKRKKRTIPFEERCMAKRADGGRCTRRRKNEKFCGTHSKNAETRNEIDDTKETGDMTEITITNIEIHGITYFTDQDGYLYMPDDILKSSPTPRIIGRYSMDEKGNPFIMN